MSEPVPATSAAPAPAKAKGKSPVMLIVVVALVVASGAGAGAFWYARRSAPPAAKAEHTSDRGVVTFEPFVVNLADPGGSRFLRISMQLLVKDAEEAESIQKKPALLMGTRSAILEVLTTQTSDRLVTAAGKTELKKAIAEHAGHVLEETKVIDVLFSDFVVQF